MFITECCEKIQYFQEAFGQNLPGQEEEPMPEPSEVIEFEDLKKILIYNKLKLLKQQLEILQLNNFSVIDKEIVNIFEFIDLIITFFNAFTYVEINTLSNTIIDAVASKLKIKIPEAEELDPEIRQLDQLKQDKEEERNRSQDKEDNQKEQQR